jgi:hypothetical protein
MESTMTAMVLSIVVTTLADIAGVTIPPAYRPAESVNEAAFGFLRSKNKGLWLKLGCEPFSFVPFVRLLR